MYYMELSCLIGKRVTAFIALTSGLRKSTYMESTDFI